ncbi:hypothetical protein [Agromyces aureus]|uniref:Uncharacterized protein n=1 Tax=Agromyces aureus TaxID=453304 RepID=A0A191WIE1_9MICO|nr:hypothetical protein [Agromyces aureus]ANJ28080.1 hypothetical protein ATC03_16550 [Agromyces aureus]
MTADRANAPGDEAAEAAEHAQAVEEQPARPKPADRRQPDGAPGYVEVPAEVQTVDEGLPNDELPDDETIVRDEPSA